jgi:hypothetical protein
MCSDLGDPITCTREGEAIEPFALVAKLQSGDLTPEAWRDCCERLGISALALSGRRAHNSAVGKRRCQPHPKLVE